MQNFCFCGSGKRQNKCHPNVNPESLVASVIKLYASWDHYVNREKIAKGIKLICNGNCHRCCNNYFYISEQEYLTIYYYLKNTYDNRFLFSKIKSAQEYISFIKNNFPSEYEKVKTLIPNELNKNTKEFFNDNIKVDQVNPCIFLNSKTGLCDIYPVRPIICRLHGVAYPYSACDNILHIKNYEKRMIDLKSFSDIEKIFKLEYLTYPGKDTILIRAYPIAEWFATLLPNQLLINDKILSCSYEQDLIDFYNLKISYYK